MNTRINQTMRASEGRYLTTKEKAVITDFFSKLDQRFKVMEDMEKNESAIANKAAETIMKAYPDFAQKHPAAKEKTIRDVTLVMRYMAHAIVRDDQKYLDDALLSWFRTILHGIGFKKEFLGDCYAIVEKVAMEELSPEAAEVTKPHFQHVREYITQSTGDEVDADLARA